MKAKTFALRLRTRCIAEHNLGMPSMTEPEQVKPLETLLKHRMQGIPIPTFNGSFHQEDLPNVFKMDFIEIAEAREQTQERIAQLQEDHHNLTVELAKHHQPAEPQQVTKPKHPPVTEEQQPEP